MMMLKNIILLVFCLILPKINCSNVIIIGAGASGLAAGTRLLEKGVTDLKILEAENRIGGRIFTKDFGGKVVELGAESCYGQVNNVVYELANPLGLLEHSKYSFEDEVFVDSSGHSHSDDIVKTLSRLLINITDNHNVYGDMQHFDGSLGEYVIQKYRENTENKYDPSTTNMVLGWFEQTMMAYDGTDSWLDVSAKKLAEYSCCDGDKYIYWKTGYKTLFDVLMRKIPDPSKQLPLEDKILLNKEVINIKWNNGDLVTVECKDGTSYTASHVIVTVSLGVLKNQHKTLFNPELPTTIQNVIHALGYGTADKIILKFPHNWWNKGGFNLGWINKNDFDNIFPGDENKWLHDVRQINAKDEQPNALVFWIAGSSAHQMETLPETAVKNNIVKLLKHFLGASYTIPDPNDFVRTTWYSNHHFRGVYSYGSVASAKLNISQSDLSKPLKNSAGKEVIFFAGEATIDDYYGTVNGAVASGWREADRIQHLL